MARESLYPFTMNEQQFLLQLAGSAHFDPTIPTLLDEYKLKASPLAVRAVHSAADRTTDRDLTDSWLEQLEPIQRTENSNGIVRRVCITEHGAAVLLEHLEEQSVLIRSAKRGIYRKFDFY